MNHKAYVRFPCFPGENHVLSSAKPLRSGQFRREKSTWHLPQPHGVSVGPEPLSSWPAKRITLQVESRIPEMQHIWRFPEMGVAQ